MTTELLAATEHLVLRWMTDDDAAALAAYRSDPVQARYQSWDTPYPIDSARAHLRRLRQPQRPLGRAARTHRHAPRGSPPPQVGQVEHAQASGHLDTTSSTSDIIVALDPE